jgi:hypothetical protein
MFHPYRAGYSVLPRLRKISHDEVFLPCPDAGRYLSEKRRAVRDGQRCFFEHDCSPEIDRDVCAYVRGRHPSRPRGDRLATIGHGICEDLAIHRMDDETDWLAAANIVFPSHWWPHEKMGKPLEEIHAPVPGMNRANGRKLVEAMVNHGPFERFVWGVAFDRRLNHHPRLPRSPFDPDNVYVKVERQVTVGFPRHRAALFVLRQYVVEDVDRPALADAVEAMSSDQLRYKGLEGCRDQLLDVLRKQQ